MTRAEDTSILELFGAVTACLARAIDLATPSQLDRLENEIVELMQSVDRSSASAKAFRSVLRQITERRGFLSRQ